MRIFGLTLIVIAYILIFVSLITYIVFYFLKKYRACIVFEKITFLIAIFSTAVESWALVLMNKGFDFNLEADLDIDYSYGLIIIIPCFIILIVFSRLIHKYKESEKYLYYVAITRAQHKLIVYNQK